MSAARSILIPAVAALALLAGAIVTASSVVSCDAGTTAAVTYREGFQKRGPGLTTYNHSVVC